MFLTTTYKTVKIIVHIFFQIVMYLLENGADPNMKDSEGRYVYLFINLGCCTWIAFQTSVSTIFQSTGSRISLKLSCNSTVL